MRRALIFAGPCLIALWASGAAAAPVSASAPARAVITEPAMVRMAWMMAMPSVAGSGSGAAFMGNLPSMSMGMMMMPGAAGLNIREGDGGPPVTAPTGFEVVRNEGGDALILRTGSGGSVAIAGDGVLMGGSILGGSAASIDLDSQPSAAPGGMLVVLVQYN